MKLFDKLERNNFLFVEHNKKVTNNNNNKKMATLVYIVVQTKTLITRYEVVILLNKYVHLFLHIYFSANAEIINKKSRQPTKKLHKLGYFVLRKSLSNWNLRDSADHRVELDKLKDQFHRKMSASMASFLKLTLVGDGGVGKVKIKSHFSNCFQFV